MGKTACLSASKLLEEKSKLALTQARMEMTQAQSKVVSTIASETGNKRAFDNHDSHHQKRYSEVEREYLRKTIQEPIQTTANDFHEIINKIENSTHRLFEYRIIDLSDRNAANPANKIFTTDEKESLKRFWDTSEQSCHFNARDSKWPFGRL
ncbi:hypothetical protein C1645_813004 [Glomus cerebriforme]|uniref:Uncharacterized protein n=1 Tax=Glomus cerebriforme TaxID=658196 RepID=A0A397TP36_9GLOM|nr:hypothetical protein C1645_813004 [Glomus cerebriforme]